MSHTVLYWNPSTTPELRCLVEREMPDGWALLVLEQDGGAEELLPRCEFLVVADRAVAAGDLARAGRLRMIQHQGVGYERIDVEECRRRGILVALTPEGTTTGVAEHTILLILALYKQLLRAANGVRQGNWLQWELRRNSFELAGKTLGLAGFGRIGQAVARRAMACDAAVVYFDPFLPAEPLGAARRVATLRDLLNQSDIVSLHLPGSVDNRHVIGESTLPLMRPHAILINTARGTLVDEAALFSALKAGRIAGAGLDVLEHEPAAPGHPLLSLDNVLVTPHIAAGTADAFRTKMHAVFENLQRHVNGEAPRHVVPELADLFGYEGAAKE